MHTPKVFSHASLHKMPTRVQSFPPEFPYTKPWAPACASALLKKATRASTSCFRSSFSIACSLPFPALAVPRPGTSFLFYSTAALFARARPLRRRSPGTHSGTWGTQRALHASLAPTAALFQKGQGPGCTARRRPRQRGQQNRGRFAARGKPWMPMLRPGARGGCFCAHTPARTKRAKNFLPAPLTMCIYGVILCISYIYAFRSTLWTLSFKTQAASPFMSR